MLELASGKDSSGRTSKYEAAKAVIVSEEFATNLAQLNETLDAGKAVGFELSELGLSECNPMESTMKVIEGQLHYNGKREPAWKHVVLGFIEAGVDNIRVRVVKHPTTEGERIFKVSRLKA